MARAGLLENSDVLLVHQDREVAEEHPVAPDDGLFCALPCPPPRDTANALRGVVRRWLGEGADGARVVIVLPMQSPGHASLTP